MVQDSMRSTFHDVPHKDINLFVASCKLNGETTAGERHKTLLSL